MESESYRKIRATFSWNIPPLFNFGVDVVDARARAADGVALIWENEAGESGSYRFSDIARLTNKLANALRAHGVRHGDRVVVMLPRIPEWPIAMVAALKIGAVPIPCVEMLTERDLAFRVEDSQARAIICRAAQTSKFEGLGEENTVRFALGKASGWTDLAEAIEAAPDRLDAAIVASEDPAVMYYTSGSTGHPKGVLHASRALYAWRVSARHWLDLSPGDIIWCTADTGWSKAGTSILFGPWSRGACAFLFDGPFIPEQRLRLLQKHRVNVYCASGTELLRVLDQDVGAFDLSALRRTVSAGEAVSPVIGERWERVTGSKIAEAYGQTETLMVALNIAGEPIKFGSMGLASPGSEVDVVDGNGARCADDEEGTIALKQPSPQLMMGYWRDEARTKACFVTGPEGEWFLTGDRARRDRDGYLWFQGRNDDVINSAGYRIGPMEVESALLEHPAVLECAVVGVPDPERGEIVKAFVVLKGKYRGSPDLVRELQDHAKTTTAPYKYPRAIEFIAELPKTVTGKIRRSELRLPKAASAGTSA